jgi:hypothetical protein
MHTSQATHNDPDAEEPAGRWGVPPPDPSSISAKSQHPLWSQALVFLILASALGIVCVVGWALGARADAPSLPVLILALLALVLLVITPVAGLLEVCGALLLGERVVLAVLPPVLLQREGSRGSGRWTVRATRLAIQSVIYDLFDPFDPTDSTAWVRATRRSYRWTLAGIVLHALLLVIVPVLVFAALRVPPLLVFAIGVVTVFRLLFFIEPLQRTLHGLRVLARPGQAQTRHLATQWVASAIYCGVPPQGWDAGQVAALTARDEELPDDATAWYYAFLYAAAMEDIDVAARYLELGLAAVQPSEASLRYALCLESAFLEAWHRNNPVRARQWLGTLPTALGGMHQMLRAKAAILLAEGRDEEGLALARKALQHVQRSPAGAVAPADAAALAEMIARVETRLVQA